MDGLSRHIAVCACAAKVETRDEVVWARCNAGEVFLEVITFLSHINSNRRLRFEGCDLSFSAHHEVLLNVPNASTLSKFHSSLEVFLSIMPRLFGALQANERGPTSVIVPL